MEKKTNITLLYFLFGCCLLLVIPACRKENTKTYTLFKPIFKAKAEVLAAINGNSSQTIETAGKIYIRGEYIYLNEVDKGIHIIDNSNPAHPVQKAFLNIPGNQDIAIKDNILYADMYSDLLAIDITDPTNVVVRNTVPDLFQDRIYVNGTYMDSNHVVADWIKKDTTVLVENSQPNFPDCDFCQFNTATASSADGSKSGVAGSMARMVMINDYLYAISEAHSVGIVNAREAAAPRFVSNMFAGFDLQTIYPFENKLFLGSASGMFMFDVTDPVNPVTLGQFSHGRACDPVISDGDYAYVTLHAGSQCGGAANELNVIDVKDLQAPQLVKSYALTRPTGLSKDGNLLFICDGSSGVRVYNAKNPADLKMLKTIKSDNPYDIITGNNRALVVAKDGLYQYDYSNINNIRLLSFFAIQ